MGIPFKDVLLFGRFIPKNRAKTMKSHRIQDQASVYSRSLRSAGVPSRSKPHTSNLAPNLSGPSSETRCCGWGHPRSVLAAFFLALMLLNLGCAAAKKANQMTKIEEQAWGQTQDGTPVKLFTLSNSKGMVAKITTYGAILTELRVPDRNGKSANVVLGFDNLERYLKGHPFFGAVAGRVANRIARGRFTLDGHEYKLAGNNGPNHLHGGIKGFDKVVWNATPLVGHGTE